MLSDRVSNPGPLTYESGALPIALRGPAILIVVYEKRGQIQLIVSDCPAGISTYQLNLITILCFHHLVIAANVFYVSLLKVSVCMSHHSCDVGPSSFYIFSVSFLAAVTFGL